MMVAVAMRPQSSKIMIAIHRHYGGVIGVTDNLYSFKFLQIDAQSCKSLNFLFTDDMNCRATDVDQATILYGRINRIL